MNDLIIGGTGIRQDAEGRFSLNDLHKAAGSEKRHAPHEFLRLSKTTELIIEIETTGNPVVADAVHRQEGRAGGTFVCKELVYAYAMWISPKFHLQVIRTFDAVVTQQAAGGEFAQGAFKEFQATRLELITTVADMTEQSLRVADLLGFAGNQSRFYADKLVKRQIGIGPMELLGVTSLPGAATEQTFTPKDLGSRFSLSPQAFNQLLAKHGFQEKGPVGETPAWRPTLKGEPHSAYEDTGRQHNGGAPVRTLRWKLSVLDELRQVATQLAPMLRPVTRG